MDISKQVTEYCSTMVPEIDSNVAQLSGLQFVDHDVVEIDAKSIDLFNQEANEMAFKLLLT